MNYEIQPPIVMEPSMSFQGSTPVGLSRSCRTRGRTGEPFSRIVQPPVHEGMRSESAEEFR
jgi:hypothetical protein